MKSEGMLSFEDDNDFSYNEQVDVIDPESKTVSGGVVISIRGRIVIVRLDLTGEEKTFDRNNECVIKQWSPDTEFQRFNRIDFCLENSNYWTEGVIIDLTNDKINVKYTNKKGESVQEWVSKNSYRISQIGSHSGKFNPTIQTCDEINSRLFKKRKFCKMNQLQEKKFRRELMKKNLSIKEVKGDGNCMFRAISDQVYGNEIYHEIVREKCMDYISLEREFFSKFIEGGEDSFDDYISMKKTLGVWGDDIELEAMSEIYGRPIEIYSHGDKPLKTFHEQPVEFNRIIDDKESNFMKFPIRISYHGKAHYNSIVPNPNNIQISLFTKVLIKGKPGEKEDEMIKKMSLRKEDAIKKEEDKDEVDIARENFEIKNEKKLDEMLEENLQKNDENANNGEDLHNTIVQSELEHDEKELLDSAIKMSLEGKEKTEQVDYYQIPSIQAALEFGFSLEDAVLAYSIYGDSTDLMLQYLYSMQEK